MANQNPSVRAGEKEDIVAARRLAAAQLQPLFVESKDDKGNPTPGVLHTFGIKKVTESSPEYAKYIDELRANPHAKSLAVVMSARGNKDFPPALVAELFPRPGEVVEEGNDWFARVYMGGLADIFAATGAGLMLPPAQAGLDFARGAYNVVAHLTPEEKSRLGLCEADEAPRRQLATDLMGMIEEKLAPLTPAQQLYRWVMKKWEARQKPRDAQAAAVPTDDPAAALPQATPSAPKPAPEPAPTPPAELVIPDLSVLTSGGPAPVAPPRTPRVSRKATAVASAAPAVVPPPAPLPAMPAEESKLAPATPLAEDEDRDIIIRALETSDDFAAKATAALLRKGKIALAEAIAVVVRKKLL